MALVGRAISASCWKVPPGYDHRSARQTQKTSARQFGWRIDQSFPLSSRSGEISISLSARVKRPGEELVSKPTDLSVIEDDTAAYERLLGDAMRGDAMLFVRED